jgi:hypothetical protein
VVTDPASTGPFTYSLTAPIWMSIDAQGRMTGTPPANITQTTTYPISVTAYDLYGAASTPQPYTLTESLDTVSPTITLDISPNPTIVGSEARFLVTALDNVGIASLTLTVNGVQVALDGHGGARVLENTAGSFSVVATAKDPAGNTVTATDTLLVAQPNDSHAPTVSIAAPLNLATITAPTTVRGTVTDAALSSWKLQVAPLDGSAPFLTIATGTANVNNSTLGTFDPTMLADGSYTLRIVAVNTGGYVATTSITVNVTAHLKLGNLHLDFTDLTIPVAGIPITITRSYDTLDANHVGDFGNGWRLGVGDFNLQVAIPGQPLQPAGLYQSFQAGTRVLLTRPRASRSSPSRSSPATS